MVNVLIWTLIYSIATAASIVLLGQRDLIAGNLFEIKRIFSFLIDWRFILSMILALVARMSFVIINNALLKIPRFASSSTTITAFITLFCLILIVIFNCIFLKEKINVLQGIGIAMVMVGIWLILK